MKLLIGYAKRFGEIAVFMISQQNTKINNHCATISCFRPLFVKPMRKRGKMHDVWAELLLL